MIDLTSIQVSGGDGGNGGMSFRREKYVPRGGPDGGDGGDGGSVIIVVDPSLTTLAHLRRRRIYRAQPGGAGSRQHRHGARGQDLTIAVPEGTLVIDEDSGETWDLDQAGATVVAGRGGEGGRGNARFATSVRQVPTFAERGMPGESRSLRLELKLLADVGLVGLPNAGKSTLLRAVSHARPEVADYPFTTLEPVLGVVDLGWDSYVVADIPGLIEGAHAGAGLGDQFLRHIERTRLLVHLVDASQPDPRADYEKVRSELALYGHDLAAKPEIIVLNKIDLPAARERLAELEGQLAADGPVFATSGATSEGVAALLARVGQVLKELSAPAADAPKTEVPVLRPAARDRLEVRVEDSVYVVSGRQAEKHAWKLAEAGPEGKDELQERLRRLGLERALRRLGAVPGANLRVGVVELEWNG
jgi:GTP-binding protein